MATVWAPDRTVTSSVQAGDTPLVVTAPGFMVMNGAEVSVVARSASGARVFLGVARTVDVNSYLRGVPHRSVIGLTAQSTPITTDATGSVRPPAPGKVDIWVQRSAGDGTANLAWVDRPGSWSLIAASDGDAGLSGSGDVSARPSAARPATSSTPSGASPSTTTRVSSGRSSTRPSRQPAANRSRASR